jgi:hypothetical protein
LKNRAASERERAQSSDLPVELPANRKTAKALGLVPDKLLALADEVMNKVSQCPLPARSGPTKMSAVCPLCDGLLAHRVCYRLGNAGGLAAPTSIQNDSGLAQGLARCSAAG